MGPYVLHEKFTQTFAQPSPTFAGGRDGELTLDVAKFGLDFWEQP